MSQLFKYLIFFMSYFIESALGRTCADKSQTATVPRGLSDLPVVLFLVTLGSKAQLPCHYCTENPNITGRIWRRRDLHGTEEEVKLDMHDYDYKNRVFVDGEHNLIIRDVTENDGAYYFCYDAEDPHGVAKMDILLDVGYRTTLEPNVLSSPVDLDVEVPRLLKGCEKLKAIGPVSKYQCYAEWGPWSRCDQCGKVGKRRRVGECRLQKLVKAEIETAKGGNKVMADFPIVGVGCHSVLLNAVKKAKEVLDQIPDIALIENCEISCEDYMPTATEMTAHKKSSFLRKIKLKIKKIKNEKQAVTAVIKEEREGTKITMFCPSASLNTPVQWKFQSKLLKVGELKDKTRGRVGIDALDALHIQELRPIDAGEYVCTLSDVEIGLIRLKDPTTNFGILTITLVFSFIVWLMAMTVKWRAHRWQQKTQKVLKTRRLDKRGESTDSEQSLLSSENEEIVEKI